MSEERKFLSKVSPQGMLTDYVRKAIGALLKGYAGQVVEVKIKKQALRRSPKQNAYYWSVVVPEWKLIFASYGTIVTDEEVHSYLVAHVGKLFKPVHGPDGEQIFRMDDGVPVMELKSTSDLSTKEFSEYVEACRSEAAIEHGVTIPSPDPYYKEGQTDDERNTTNQEQEEPAPSSD